MFFESVKKGCFLIKGLRLDGAHVCRPGSVFFGAHIAGEKDRTFFAPAGAKAAVFFVSGAYSPPGCGFATRKIMRGVSVLAFVFGAMDSVMNELPPMTEFAPMTVLPPRMDAPE